jgi:hypothetical protein
LRLGDNGCHSCFSISEGLSQHSTLLIRTRQ